MEWYFIPVVILGGFAAGFVNTLAGSGSLITLPLLIFIGLPANVANGTNRVAIFLESLVGINTFKRNNVLDLRGVFVLGIPAVVGSVLGAQIAVNLNEQLMRQAIGIIMILMLFIIILRPKRWLHGELEQIGGWPNWKQMAVFFFIGIYGGFIQAGVGIFLLAGLVLGIGYDLVRANAVKVGIVFFYTIFAIMVFLRHGQVDWIVGLILAIGNMLGAWVAARIAVDQGAIWIRRLLIVVVGISAVNLLGLLDLIKNLF